MTNKEYDDTLQYITDKANRLLMDKYFGHDNKPLDVEKSTQSLVKKGLKDLQFKATPNQKFMLEFETRAHLIFWKKEYKIGL